MEFYALEPWGFSVEDLRHARASEVVARAAGAKEVSTHDFMMSPPTPDEIEEIERDRLIEQMKKAFGNRNRDEDPRSTPQGSL